MIVALALLLTTAAPPDPAPARGRIRVLVLDLRGVDAETARLVRDEVAVTFGKNKQFDVVSTEDLRRVAAIESDKQASGCADDGCLAELGAALGARYIIHGNLSALAGASIVQLSLFDTVTARALGRETAEAPDSAALLPAVRAAAGRLADQLAPDSGSGLAWTGGVVAGAGALGLVVAGVVAGLAYGPTVDGSGATRPADRQAAQTAGAVATVSAVVAGAVALGGAGVLAWGLTP